MSCLDGPMPDGDPCLRMSHLGEREPGILAPVPGTNLTTLLVRRAWIAACGYVPRLFLRQGPSCRNVERSPESDGRRSRP